MSVRRARVRRTEARWWSETPDGELVEEFSAPYLLDIALREAITAGRRLIFRSSETYETA